MMDSMASRRGFVAGSVVAGLGAAAAVACADGVAGHAGTEIPAVWDRMCDVLVVGAGCGMASAIVAKEAGADVLVIDKNDHVGGLFMTSGGNATMGGNNIVQREAEVEDTNDQWFADEMAATGYRANSDVVRTLVDRGAETVQWMTDLGFVWAPLSQGQIGATKRGVGPAANPGVYEGGMGTPNSGIAWTQVWERRLEELGVPVLIEHRMTRLYREDGGRVVGAQVETPEGTIEVGVSKGVVLATGSWTDNARMVQAWDPRLVGDDCYGDGGIPATGQLFVESTGDGHLAAQAVGGLLTDMSFTSYLYLIFGARSYWSWGEEPIDWTTNENMTSDRGLSEVVASKGDFYRNCIMVANNGSRYVNESLATRTFDFGKVTERPEDPYNEAYLALDRPRNVWIIGDSAIAEDGEWPLDEIENPNPRIGCMLDPDCVAIADTIEELAEKMGMSADALRATVDTYNGYVDAGVDGDFGKEGLTMRIEEPPFYGLKASMIRHIARNGLRVNTKMQVIDGAAPIDDVATPVAIDDEPVIEGLYAVGEVGNCVGWRRAHNTLGHFTTAARIAGENVAR